MPVNFAGAVFKFPAAGRRPGELWVWPGGAECSVCGEPCADNGIPNVVRAHHPECFYGFGWEQCKSTSAGNDGCEWICTRPAGHEGPHIACYSDAEPCKVSPWD